MTNLLTSILGTRSAAERTARAALAVADKARQAAELELQARIESVQRLRQVIQDAETAEQAANLAEAAVTSAASEWARAGAKETETSNHEALIDQAAERRRQAVAARSRAMGAERETPAAQGAVQDAKTALRSERWAVDRAIGPMLIESIEDYSAQLDALVGDVIPKLNAAVAQILAINEAGSNCGPTSTTTGFNTDISEHTKPMLATLQKLKKEVDFLCSGRSRGEPVTRWESFVKRLRVEPDADLEDA